MDEYNIIIMIADLMCIGLSVWLYFVVFDDTHEKEIERKERIDGLFGRGRFDQREKKK